MASLKKRADFGPRAYLAMKGKLPNIFPRVMGPNAEKYLREVAESGLTSDMPERFEKAFAEALGVRHCIATPGCTAALAALAAAFGFEPGDEIIVSPITDFGTIQGLLRENYIPVFPDTEAGGLNFSARTIEPRLTDRTRAILVVHKAGIVCDMDPINALAAKRGLIVYEDCCQALFSTYKGRYAGTLATAAAFSFDAEKTMGSDIGGCVVTQSDGLADLIRYRGQARGAYEDPEYGRVHTYPGYAYRMPLATAAITLAQLEIARDNVARRDRLARRLTALLADIPGITPLAIPDYMGVFSCWLIGFSLDPAAFRCGAAEFARQAADEGITGAGMGRYYLMPEACAFLRERAAGKIYPYSQPPASRAYAYGPETCPNGYEFLKNFIRWNTFSEKYTDGDVDLAAEIVRRVAERNARG
jgi:dTDP-4-amino-4,6-dideoxygalactose transaminase